jgi:predicted RNA binding protein YcfA (HicA-like mRNA interferase family)
MKAKELFKLLRKNGWELDRSKGSHFIFKKDGVSISVPVHGNDDLKIGTLNNIFKQANIKKEK